MTKKRSSPRTHSAIRDKFSSSPLKRFWGPLSTAGKWGLTVLSLLGALATILAVFPEPQRNNLLHSVGLLPPSATPTATATYAFTPTPINTPTATDTNTPSPTATPTPTPTSVEVALIPVRIVSVSGIEIGNGTVRVFAPDSIESSQSTTIELELNPDYRYITPTPAGPITPIAVTPITSTPRPGRATPTPRIPIYVENNITAYQRMGATLLCPPDRFTGCDTTRDPATAKLVDWEEGAKWSWIIAPTQRFIGLQSLQLELWTIKRINDGPEQADVVWDYPFQIEVKLVLHTDLPMGEVLDALFTIGAVGAALIGAGYIWRRKNSSKSKVFISYRRVGGADAAQIIKNRLTAKGADVFLDVKDINAGRFADIILSAIEQREYFVLVLAPDTLESEWVVKETLHAIQLKKQIIPILIQGFSFEAKTLPSGLESIRSHNAIDLKPEYYDEGLERLAKFVGLETEKGR